MRYAHTVSRCTKNTFRKAMALTIQIEKHIGIMQLVYDMVFRKEIKGETVPNEEKIYSIYEQHTDIIVKGSRQIQFGHKVDLSSGKSNLVLNCQVLHGNPSDSKLFIPAVDAIVENYGKMSRDYASDGGYASLANQAHAKEKGIVNIVFNKIVGSLRNIASSKNMETRLKKWRSDINNLEYYSGEKQIENCLHYGQTLNNQCTEL